MKLKYIYTLLILILALYLVPAVAQTNKKVKPHKVKAHVKKPVKKPVKKSAKPSKPVVKTKTGDHKNTAKSLGDAIANAKSDTSKNPGDVNKGGLSEEIVVTTAYKPVLADAVKIRINPDLDDKAAFKAPLNYSPIDKRLELNSDIKQLESIARPVEKDSDLFNNYVKIGAGNLKTTYGELYLNNGYNDALQYGLYLKHYALDGEVYKQNSAKEAAGAFLKTVGQQNALTARVDYSYNSNYFYGFSQPQLSALFPVDKQSFSTVRAEAELAKNYKDVENDFTYAFKLNGYLFNNAFQAKESNVVLSGFVNETIDQFYAGLSGSLDLTTQQDSLYNYNNSIVRVNPYLKFQGESYKIDAGINVADEFGFSSSVHIFPAAKLEFEVIPRFVRLFAEVKGDVNKASLLDFTTTNPFLGQDVPIKNSVDQLDLLAGLKGTLAPGLSFKVSAFRNSVKDMPLIVSNFNFAKGYNRFTVIYDNGTSKINGLNGEIDFKASESLDFFGRVEIKQYNMATVPFAWNLPKHKLTGGTIIHISNTINITGTMVLRGSTLDPYIAPGSASPASIKSFGDLSGGIEYKASKRISIFVNVNNILNTNNVTWLYYPDYRFNIFGGVSLGF